MANVSSSNSLGERVPKLRFPGFEGEWKREFFSELFDFLSNNTLSRAELSETGNIRNIHYGDILVKYTDVINVDDEIIPFVSNASEGKVRCDMLCTGDVIIADTAEDDTVGKATEIINHNNKSVVSGLHTMPCRPNRSFISSFLGYYINSNAYHLQLYPYMQGIKVTSISKANIRKTLISFPSTNEQKKIVELFNLIEKKILLQKRLVEFLKLYKRGVIQRVFSGEITGVVANNNWETVSISELFTNIIDKGYPEETVLTIIQGYGTIPRDSIERRISYDSSSVASYKRVMNDDFILHLRSFEGGLEISNHKGIVSPAYTILRSKKTIVPAFFYTYFRSYEFIENKLRIAVEGIRDGKSINMDTFWKLHIPFPSLEVQQFYANVFSSFDRIIEKTCLVLTGLNNTKKFLLQQLFI